MKRSLPWIKIVLAIIVWLGLSMYQNYFMIFDTNAAAIGQVESSDLAYAKWQSWKHIIDYFWLLYLVPLLMFIPEVCRFIKNK